MCAVLLLVLVGLVVGETLAPRVAPTVGYHEALGIPKAARIKASEEAVLAPDLANIADRIVGGVIAPANSHPYLGGLVISLIGIAGNSVCGSSLLSPNRLVTAAHCWFDGTYRASQFTVVLGSQFLFSGGSRIATSNVVMHPAWSPRSLQNDVAMIYLPRNVSFTQSVQPISLPPTTQVSESFAGWTATAAGYGMTSDAQTGVSPTTQVSQVTVPVITNSNCQMTFGQWVTGGNICTGGAGGKGVCGGDSGGPLVVRAGGQLVLVGISSFVAWDGCQAGQPSAFARVTSFYFFIVHHLF